MKQQYKAFMGQFEAARKDVERMPAWMKESAKLATLTYPSAKPEPGVATRSQPTKKKS